MNKNDEKKLENCNNSILIVDDHESLTILLQKVIKSSGYTCLIADSGEHALELMQEKAFDVVITDIKMEGMQGIELIKRIIENYNTDVIAMSGYIEEYTYEQIISLGAKEFIYKPLNPKELLVRLKRVLRERTLLDQRNQKIEEIKNAHLELHDAYIDTINRLAMAAEYKDEDSSDHIMRISKYSAFISERLGLDDTFVQNILYSSPMHDVGKIGISDNILFKTGKLSKREFNIMKTHTSIGASILDNSNSDILKNACLIALNHHEKWNGTGYPHGISGESIPLCARIVGLVDVFDALTSIRPYKKPYPVEIAVDIIKNERGKHFDPTIVDVFLSNIEALLSIKEKISPDTNIELLSEVIWSERDIENMANSNK